MKITKTLFIAAIASSTVLVSCKDEEAEKAAADLKMEQEMAEKKADSLEMVEKAKMERDATAMNLNGAINRTTRSQTNGTINSTSRYHGSH